MTDEAPPPDSQIEFFLSRVEDVVRKRKVFRSERAWCRAAGVADTYIAALRNRGPKGKGTVTTFKLEHVERLAAAAGVTTAWLAGVKAMQTLPSATDVSAVATLRAALDAYPWPQDVTIDEASSIVRKLEKEAAAAAPWLPQSVWTAQIARALALRKGKR